MEKGQFLRTEAARNRAASILHAQAAIRTNIWSAVSMKGYMAYHALNAAVYAGVVIDDFFINREGRTIEDAFPVLGAHLQQTLVDAAIVKLLELNRTAPREKHDIVLFPPIETDDSAKEGRSVIDVLKVVPGKFEKVVLTAAELARIQVACSIVTHDTIAERLKIDTPLLHLPFIVDDFSIITVPTVINGVYLRYSKKEGNPDVVTEFVMEAL